MKCLAHRLSEDDDDVGLLADRLHLDATGVLDVVEAHVGARLLTAQVRFFVAATLDAEAL